MKKSAYQSIITVGLLPIMLTSCDSEPKDPLQPNIIWIMAEDIGTDLGCYGRTDLQTPVLDQLAADGILYNRAYCTNPICSPNRSAMMTGMYQTTIGAHHHRSHRNDGYHLPDPVKPITSYLREAGYYCAIGCGYHKKTDLNFQVEEPLFDGDDWSAREPDQPFFAQITLAVTHRGNWWNKTREESTDPVDPANVDLPPYIPDHPLTRKDWAIYLDQMEKADYQVGEILKRLQEEGIENQTIVIFIGDNGRCHVRGKGFLYEDGIHVPLIIRWPNQIKAGKTSERLVSTIDISAQILKWAGAEVPDHMEGMPFADRKSTEREFVIAARDRWDEVYDKSRTIVGPRYKYIRNDRPERGWAFQQDYVEKNRPMYNVIREMIKTGQTNPAQEWFFRDHKPAEELYDLKNDPWELTNLANQTDFKTIKEELKKQLIQWEIETDDQGRYPEPESAVQKGWIEKIRERDRMIDK